MKIRSLFSSATTTAIALAIVSSFASAADAFTLSSTSSRFDNARLTGGQVVGQSATNSEFSNYQQASFSQSHGNRVRFHNDLQLQDGRTFSQVRWGRAWNSRNRQSGLGFIGSQEQELEVGQLFNLGKLLHFNNTILANNLVGTQTDFSLNLDFAVPEIGSQTFDFSLNVDETNNRASSHSGGVCPYETLPGQGCSDRITWDFELDESSQFTYNGIDYTLELVGFSDNILSENNLDSANVVTDFVSQESQTSYAYLWGKLVEVETPPRIKKTPEPAALMGLSMLGLFFARSRRKKNAADVA